MDERDERSILLSLEQNVVATLFVLREVLASMQHIEQALKPKWLHEDRPPGFPVVDRHR